MSWLGLYVVGLALTDLTYSLFTTAGRRTRIVPECVGAAALILIGVAGGLTEARDVVVVIVLALSVLVWGQLVTRGFGSGVAWPPLVWLALSLGVVLAASPAAGEFRGGLVSWMGAVPLAVLADQSPERLVLVSGLMLAQLSTGNVIVRLVLSVTGTSHPLRRSAGDADGREIDTQRLKGGRLIGPLERLFILGLGLAGELTAAGIIVAAKGLIRFPELQAARDADRDGTGPDIHDVTEYFLLGTLMSWSVPLVALALLAG